MTQKNVTQDEVLKLFLVKEQKLEEEFWVNYADDVDDNEMRLRLRHELRGCSIDELADKAYDAYVQYHQRVNPMIDVDNDPKYSSRKQRMMRLEQNKRLLHEIYVAAVEATHKTT
jgi:hypothetical protein